MSIISASTTSTTAFKITTDTTGALVFQTGSSPTTALTLDTSQNATLVGNIRLNNGAADGAQLVLASSGYSDWNIDNYSGNFRWYYNTTEYMRLDTSGRLGIGTPSPAYNLHVTNSGASGTLSLSPASTNGGASYILMGNSDSSGTSGPSIIAAANRNLQFGVGSSFTSAGGGTFTEYMRLDSSGNLGLGVTPSAWGSPFTNSLEGRAGSGITFGYGTGTPVIYFSSNAYYNGTNWIYKITGYPVAQYYLNNANGSHSWYTAGSGTAGGTVSLTQAMTLDASGNLGLGTAASNFRFTVAGAGDLLSVSASASGQVLRLSQSSANPLIFRMVNNSGNFWDTQVNTNNSISWDYNDSVKASIDSGGDWTFPFGWLKSFSDGGTPCLGIGTSDTGFMFLGNAPKRIIPRNFAGTGADNQIDLGDSGSRYKTIYAATGTINTSDAREKTAVTPLTADELTAAAQIAASVGTYQWLQAVEEKGAAARHHAGLTVQRAIEIMEANNLDPFAYGFICYDSWQTEEYDGQVLRVAGDRYSFRMDELSLFIARGQQAIIETLTSRIAALENK